MGPLSDTETDRQAYSGIRLHAMFTIQCIVVDSCMVILML